MSTSKASSVISIPRPARVSPWAAFSFQLCTAVSWGLLPPLSCPRVPTFCTLSWCTSLFYWWASSSSFLRKQIGAKVFENCLPGSFCISGTGFWGFNKRTSQHNTGIHTQLPVTRLLQSETHYAQWYCFIKRANYFLRKGKHKWHFEYHIAVYLNQQKLLLNFKQNN